MTIRIGTKLYGHCGGDFGYSDKRWIESFGADWAIVRDNNGQVHFYDGDPDDLERYTTEDPDDYLDDVYLDCCFSDRATCKRESNCPREGARKSKSFAPVLPTGPTVSATAPNTDVNDNLAALGDFE